MSITFFDLYDEYFCLVEILTSIKGTILTQIFHFGVYICYRGRAKKHNKITTHTYPSNIMNNTYPDLNRIIKKN
jgi:hypothetical protein